MAGGLVRLHHQFDGDRFFVPDDVENGYRWWFTKQLKRDDVVLAVAEVDGAVAGYVYSTLEERDWNLLLDAHGAIHDVFVDPAFRRHGAAKALMRFAIAALEALGAPRVVLSSAFPNREAQALFRSLGFRETMVEMTRTAQR
jgi:ribosomal protein S18 acetylase RimI-like enzyme